MTKLRPQHRQQSSLWVRIGSIRTALKLLVCVVLVWLLSVARFFSYSSSASTLAATRNELRPKAQTVLSNHNFYDNKPYYVGWQPPNYDTATDESSCKVSECFKGKGIFNAHQHCKRCNDDPADMSSPVTVNADWVPDAGMLHSMLKHGYDRNGNVWPPPLSNEYCKPLGANGGPFDDNKELFDAVPLIAAKTEDDLPTLFCGIYTMEVNHGSTVRAIRETWAPECNGFVAFSTASDARIPAISVPHDGPEEYNNMWQKSRSIWHYIGEHYLEEYDYFILGGEDLFVIPNNLRRYLQSLHLSPDTEDLFAGRRFKGYGNNNYFNSGGAGYVLSRETLRKYYEIGYDHPKCNPTRHTAMEDVMIAECLRNVFNIGLTDTRDGSQRERFHPFAPGNHYKWQKSPVTAKSKDWYENYNAEWGILEGADCCAPDSVSFHYIKKAATARHLWSLLYHCV